MYEQGRRDPDTETLKRLANLYDVSSDYLLSLNNEAKAHKGPDKNLIMEILRTQNSLPLIGIIRAGLPIVAHEHIDGFIDVPANIKADYVLRVQGDSMIGAGILDGDYALCKETQGAISGQIVVALHDEGSISEATLKYYYDNGNGNGPVLRAANPNYEEIPITGDHRIVGVMVALIRDDITGYQVYKDYLALDESDEWTEVIELATSAGLNANQTKEIITAQIEIVKRLKR